jgi:hypothetical protein
MVCLAQRVHLCCTDTNTVSELTRTRFHRTHITESHRACLECFSSLWYFRCNLCTYVPSRLAPQWTETSFLLGLVTLEFHRLHLKWFPSLWYVWHKLCTYLALTLSMSSNESKRDSTWPTSPRISIWCIQNYIWANGMFGVNHAPILHWH